MVEHTMGCLTHGIPEQEGSCAAAGEAEAVDAARKT